MATVSCRDQVCEEKRWLAARAVLSVTGGGVGLSGAQAGHTLAPLLKTTWRL